MTSFAFPSAASMSTSPFSASSLSPSASSPSPPTSRSGTISPPPRSRRDRSSSAATSHSQWEAENKSILDVFHTRKAWKKSSSNGERIWPEQLELVLIEGLRAFKPDPTSRETTMLGRYPHRNKFISQYIYDHTGESRTPKQVGSRLQQLREYGAEDTEQGRLLQQLLTPIRPGTVHSHPSSSNSKTGSGSSSLYATNPSSSSPSFYGSSSTDGSDATTVWVDILPKSCPPSTSSTARPIQTINPTVAFASSTLSRSAVISSVSTLYDVESQTSVFRSGSSLTFENEVEEEDGNGDTDEYESVNGGRKRRLSDGGMSDRKKRKRIYVAPLAPGFWNELVGCDDPTKYAVDLYVAERQQSGQSRELLRVIYRFRYPADVHYQSSVLTSELTGAGSGSPTVSSFSPIVPPTLPSATPSWFSGSSASPTTTQPLSAFDATSMPPPSSATVSSFEDAWTNSNTPDFASSPGATAVVRGGSPSTAGWADDSSTQVIDYQQQQSHQGGVPGCY